MTRKSPVFWSLDEENLIHKFYPKMGPLMFTLLPGKPKIKVAQKARRMGVKMNKLSKSIITSSSIWKRKNHLVDQYITDFTPESAYVLGLLAADGHISIKTRTVCINNCYDDMVDVLSTFKESSPAWNFNYIVRQKNYKPKQHGNLTSPRLTNFLIQLGYKNKNFSSILKIIPEELRPLWFRGFLDGDGCWFLHTKNKIKNCTFVGPYDQDWEFIASVADSLGLKYSISRSNVTNKGVQIGRCSYFRIRRIRDLLLWGEYLYRTYKDDSIGFKRKYQKWLEIKNSPQRNTRPDVYYEK